MSLLLSHQIQMRCLLNFKRIDLFANCFLYFALHFPVLSQTEATTKLSFHLNEKLHILFTKHSGTGPLSVFAVIGIVI